MSKAVTLSPNNSTFSNASTPGSISKQTFLKIRPKELVYHPPFVGVLANELKLMNTSEHTLAYKVKTTAPVRYCVRPNTGIIPPGEVIEVQILLNCTKDMPSISMKTKDKFQIQSIIVSEPNIDPKLIWLNSPPNQIMKQKLKAVFSLPQNNDNSSSSSTSQTGLTTQQNESTLKNELIKVALNNDNNTPTAATTPTTSESTPNSEYKSNQPFSSITNNTTTTTAEQSESHHQHQHHHHHRQQSQTSENVSVKPVLREQLRILKIENTELTTKLTALSSSNKSATLILNTTIKLPIGSSIIIEGGAFITSTIEFNCEEKENDDDPDRCIQLIVKGYIYDTAPYHIFNYQTKTKHFKGKVPYFRAPGKDPESMVLIYANISTPTFENYRDMVNPIDYYILLSSNCFGLTNFYQILWQNGYPKELVLSNSKYYKAGSNSNFNNYNIRVYPSFNKKILELPLIPSLLSHSYFEKYL
eukprot:gene5193-6464_t